MSLSLVLRRAAASSALALLMLGGPYSHAAGLGKADFQEALVGAMTDKNLRDQTVRGEQLKMQELQGVSAQGAWRVDIVSACSQLGTANSVSRQAGQLMRYQQGSVFANTGGNFQFMVNSQVVQPHQREAVEKALVERLQSLNGEYRDLRAEVRRQDNGAYQLVAQHDYGDGTGAGTARSRLAATLGHARFMICDIHTAMELADHDRWRALRSTRLGQVDRGTFVTLYPLLKESGYEAKGHAPGGTWRFKLNDEVRPRVENFVNEMKVWVFTKPPAPPDAARMATIAANIRALSLPLGATRVEPTEPNEQGYIWVALVFSYAELTGDDFGNVLKKLIDKEEAVDFHRQVVRAVAQAY